MYDNFLFRAKRTVYKWWCIVYKPVYRLIHNGDWPEEKEPSVRFADPKPTEVAETAEAIKPAEITEPAEAIKPAEATEPAAVDDDVLARANEIMARLNREAAEDEAKKQHEIDIAKEKAAEQERLAAILKSTERNIDAYIQEGLSKQHQQDGGN